MWETWVLSLGWEDPLEEGMETRSSILAWRIPSTEEPGGLQSMELQLDSTERRTLLLFTFTLGGVECREVCSTLLCAPHPLLLLQDLQTCS